MRSEEAWNNLKEKFTSANRIPVERSNITHEEYEAIKDDRALLEEAVKLLSDMEVTIVDDEALSIIRDFLTRAKERGIG